MSVQCTDVKKVLGSVHKMNLGEDVVFLDSARSYTQKKKWPEDKNVMHTWVPSQESEVREGSEKVLKGNRFAILATESEDTFNRQE